MHESYQTTKKPQVIHHKLKDVFHFLEWKVKLHSSEFSPEDLEIIYNRSYSEFTNLSAKSCHYTRNMITKYTEELWSTSNRVIFQLDGYPSAPVVSSKPIPIPRNTPRETEVKLISLFYKNNLLNQSLYKLDRAPSPMCPYCNQEEETPDHLLFRCAYVDLQLRNNAIDAFESALKGTDTVVKSDTFISLLSACKSDKFVKCCTDIVNCLNIKLDVVL